MVVLLPIVHKFGFIGLLLTGFLAGMILVLLAIARFGRMLQFIPHPVATGLHRLGNFSRSLATPRLPRPAHTASDGAVNEMVP